MRRIRWLIAGTLILSFFFGLAFPFPSNGGASSGDRIAVYMQPPTLSWGSYPLLTCGWHSTCEYPYTTGTALDWDDDDIDFGNPWYYRSFNVTTHSSVVKVAAGAPVAYQSGGTTCEIMAVWIVDPNGNLRAIPMYTHTNITNSSSFNIYGGAYPQIQHTNHQVGVTVNDSRTNCPTTGSHVNEYYYPWSGSTYTKDSLYPSASTCHDSCGTFLDSDVNNYTRRFNWTE
jgi:hypothetical protein